MSCLVVVADSVVVFLVALGGLLVIIVAEVRWGSAGGGGGQWVSPGGGVRGEMVRGAPWEVEVETPLLWLEGQRSWSSGKLVPHQELDCCSSRFECMWTVSQSFPAG